MNFDVDLFIVVSGLLFASIWLAVAIGRLNLAWKTGVQSLVQLKAQQVYEAKEMLQVTSEALRLEEEIKETQTSIAKTAKLHTARAKIVGNRPAAVAPEIHVVSEFPSSPKDKPWVAYLKRTGANRARRADEATAKFVLVWAADHPSAMGRARAIIAADPDLEVEGMRRFDVG